MTIGNPQSMNKDGLCDRKSKLKGIHAGLIRFRIDGNVEQKEGTWDRKIKWFRAFHFLGEVLLKHSHCMSLQKLWWLQRIF